MSYEYMTPIIRHKGLSPTEKLVLFAIAEHINPKTKVGWPSYDTIADLAGCKRRWAIKTVENLAARGILRVTKRRLADKQGSNLYEIIGLTQSVLNAPCSTPRVSSTTTQSALNDSFRVSPNAPESVRNQKESRMDFSPQETLAMVLDQRLRLKTAPRNEPVAIAQGNDDVPW